MDQVKIGRFLAQLRKENGLTQEQLADKLNVARRTVSRWETGSNMPDMDILIELSDNYSVDLREILDGERRADKMDKDVEETVLKVSEYEKEGKKKDSTIVIVYSSIGIAALITHVIVSNIDMPDNFATGFIKGLTFGLALGAMLLSIIYATGTMAKMNSFKKRLISRQG